MKSWEFGGIGGWWSKERITWKKSSLRSAKSRTTCLQARKDTYITLRNPAASAQRWSLLSAKLSIKTRLFNLPHAVFLLQLSNYYVDTRYDEGKFDIFLIFIYILPSVNRRQDTTITTYQKRFTAWYTWRASTLWVMASNTRVFKTIHVNARNRGF